MLVENLKFLTGHTHFSKTGDLVTATVTHKEFTILNLFLCKTLAGSNAIKSSAYIRLKRCH